MKRISGIKEDLDDADITQQTFKIGTALDKVFSRKVGHRKAQEDREAWSDERKKAQSKSSQVWAQRRAKRSKQLRDVFHKV